MRSLVLKTTGINIREAVEDDLLDCLMLFKQFHKESKVPYNWDKTKTSNVFTASLSLENIAVLVAENEEGILGFICGLIAEPIFSNQKVASELAWFVNKDYRNTSAGFRLLKSYEEWAIKNKANFITMAYLENVTDLAKIYTKMGYSKTETNYVKEI